MTAQHSTSPATDRRPSAVASWIEAMRPRTLPVSAAGVLMAAALGVANGRVLWLPWAICLLFALLAQTASNFANEYFDFRNGLDRKGRVGPRRGVTEGDITPRAMLRATLLTLALASAVGCTLIVWGGWWLIAAGVVIVLAALAYSAGPWALSRHALGEVAVIVFFGLVPVTLTYHITSGPLTPQVWATAVATGLLGANILIVNNYRDIDDDRAVGKTTLAVLIGRKATSTLYLFNGIVATGVMLPQWNSLSGWWHSAPMCLLIINIILWINLQRRRGSALNPLLGATALFMLVYSLTFLTANLLSR